MTSVTPDLPTPDLSTPAYFEPAAVTTDDLGTTWTDYLATAHTVSPWGPDLQHGAPPSALVTHVLEQAAPQGGRLVRVTTELLGAVPVARLRTTARVVRPGRRISYLEAVVTDTSGREVLRGSAWWIRTADTTAVENPQVPSAAEMLPRDRCTDATEFLEAWASPYIDTIEMYGSGSQAWIRSTIPVVAGVPDSPWTSLMAVADATNGVDRVLDPREWQFMNTDLTVSLHRLPGQGWAGDGWTGVHAEANLGPDGIGLTIGRLHDAHGPLGSTNQSLLLQPVG